MDEIKQILTVLRNDFGGCLQDDTGRAGDRLLQAAGFGSRRGEGLLARAEQEGLIERQIHGKRTLLVREPKRGLERKEPRDLMPPSPASIAKHHLERAWYALRLQDRRILSGEMDTVMTDFAFYVVAHRWLLRALKLVETVEGGPKALAPYEELRNQLYRMDIRDVLEHFDDREQGKGSAQARKEFPLRGVRSGPGPRLVHDQQGDPKASRRDHSRLALVPTHPDLP